jgi:F-type H+-transporting ATPase subunit epsilon
MATIKLDIVTAERRGVFEDVDIFLARGIEGDMGIFPHHAPLMTMLQPGELGARKRKQEISLAISGGFL